MRRATLLVLFAASTFAVAAACESVPALTFRAPDAELDEAGPDAGDAGDATPNDSAAQACDPDAPPLGVGKCCRNGIGCAGTGDCTVECPTCETLSGCGPGSLCCTKSQGATTCNKLIGDTCR